MREKNDNKIRYSFADCYVKIVEKVTDATGIFAAYLLVPMVIVFLIEIIARNVFNSPTKWAFGTCFILGGIAAVLGLAYGMKHGAMVRIDVIHSRLSEKSRCILDLILFATLFLPLTIGGSWLCLSKAISSVMVLEKISSGSWMPPIWPTKIAMAYGMILLTLQGTVEIIKLIQKLREIKGKEQEANV